MSFHLAVSSMGAGRKYSIVKGHGPHHIDVYVWPVKTVMDVA